MTSRSRRPCAPAGEGRYTADVHQDWEIWGPCGGYVAAIALRAAGAESGLTRPASFFCHYLSVAAFEPVDLSVTTLRSGRTVHSQRVEMTQQGRPVLDAMVWSVGDVAGLEHEDMDPPDVPGPGELPNREEVWPDEDSRPRFSFWGNFDQRMIETVGGLAPDRTSAADVADVGPPPADVPRSTTPGWTVRVR